MKTFVIILLLLPLFSFGQKNIFTSKTFEHPIDKRNSVTTFKKIYLGKEKVGENVHHYLLSNFKNLQQQHITIQLTNIINSPAGVHLTYDQYYNGIKVYRSQIKVNLDKQGNIISIFNNSFFIDEELGIVFPAQRVADDYIRSVNTIPTKVRDTLLIRFRNTKTYFYTGSSIVPAIRIEIEDLSENYYEVILDKMGQVLYQQDLLVYYSPQDTTVTATVFMPDPLTTAGVTYGTPYVDNDDGDVPEINAERVTVTMTVEYDTGVFRLESPYVKITEHSNPKTIPATSTTPDFSFTRSQDEFEDVNAYYHVSAFRNYIKSVGFDSLVNFLIDVDAHGHNGKEQSSFNRATNPPRLSFGDGGVDDAEDADVIIHEYGHAIQDAASPNTNYGTERQSIDEANGDYFAVSYSRAINPYKWENVFSWDGHNEFWLGRSAVSTKHYPENNTGSKYERIDIWSSTLMEIWGDIGREETDRLLLQSVYSYASNMTMPEAAMLIVQADSMLNNGAYHTSICNSFNDRGILDKCKLGDYCSPIALFSSAINDFTVTFFNTSYNGTSYVWNFGDGGTDTVSNPIHTYNNAENYIVTLITTNSCGTDTIADTLKVGKFTDISLKNSIGFLNGETDAVISFRNSTNATITLFDIRGKIIFKEELSNINQFSFNGHELKNGVYIINVINQKEVKNFKLVKL